MGFFDVIGKMFRGEPMFKVPTEQQRLPARHPHPEASHEGPKLIPQVMIERWQCTEQGAGLHCEIAIRNYSKGGAVLQRIELLGTRDELGDHLDAGEHLEYQFHLARRPKDTHLDECDIYFRNEEGDYFLAKHQVEFEKQPDGTFSIMRFRLLPPIRDV